jgi:hypothetical protein
MKQVEGRARLCSEKSVDFQQTTRRYIPEDKTPLSFTFEIDDMLRRVNRKQAALLPSPGKHIQ